MDKYTKFYEFFYKRINILTFWETKNRNPETSRLEDRRMVIIK